MRKTLSILFAWLCIAVANAATITGPIFLAYSNAPYTGTLLFRPLSTPLPYTPNLITGGDFRVQTATNGVFSVDLAPGNYRVQVGADKSFIIDVPTNIASFTLLERITNALAWNSSIVPATNSYQLALSTRSGVVKSSSNQGDPVAWLTNDTATIGKWLGYVTASTIDSLISATAPDFHIGTIVTKGWSTENDGRGGTWIYEYGATTATNTGMVVAWGSGRLLRVWDKEIDPKWFGADDTGVLDSAAPLQSSLDFASRPTYGWQSTVGVNAPTGYSGAFIVKAFGMFALYSPVYITDGVILEGKPGVVWGEFTGHTLFNIKHGGSGFIISLYTAANGYRIGGIKHVNLVGYPQTYQGNKKTITAVTDRLTFKVADADAPPTLDDVTIRPGNNTCFFYDSNSEYLGSARIASTSSSAGQTTVVLHNGTDAFTSINGTSGGALTTSCKVVWPVRVTDELPAVAPAFNDPALAGTVGINVKNLRTGSFVGVGNPVLEDIEVWGFHCGFRFGPGTSGSLSPLNSLRSTRHKFAGFACARPENVADLVFSGGTYTSGYYTIDPTQSLATGPSLTVTAATPAVFTKASHGYIANSGIRFGAATVPTGLTAGTMYYVSATGLTANTFQVSASFGGSSIGLSSTGSGLFVAGNVFDYPSLNAGTYGIYGPPDFARYDTVVAEFSALANVYTFRTIGPHMKYLFSDGTGRYGVMLNAGYGLYSSPTSATVTDWFGVDHFLAKPMPSGSPYDTFHTDNVAVYFEPTDASLFAGFAASQFSTVYGSGPKFSHAFNLQHPSYNNVAKIGMVLESNGHTNWFKSGPGKAPDVDAPNLRQAADVYTGWYGPVLDQRDFAVAGTRVASFTAGNLLLEASTGRPLTLKSTTSGTTPQSVIGNNIFSWENTADSLRFGGWYSDSVTASSLIGSTAFTGTARSSKIEGESMSGTDKNSGDMYVIGNRGTGAGTSGSIFFQTGVSTVSGTTGHTPTSKLMIPNSGGLRILASAADIPGSGVGHINWVSGSINNFRFWDRDSWQPLSPNSAEQSIASAGTMQLALSTSEKIFITGNATITSFGTAQAGLRRFLRFEGPLTITRNATSLEVPGAANIPTAAGDTAEAHSAGAGNWRIVSYQRASGAALVSSGGVSDGDKGDISVTGSGATYIIDNSAVTYAKMQNVSAVSKLLGRNSTTTGPPEEITLGSGLTMTGTTLSSSGGAGVTDGDKGDITISGSGANYNVDNLAITYAKIQNVSATDKLLGRSTAGAGSIEEIPLTAAGRALIDDLDATAQRTTLGLGTLATQSGTFSGTHSGTSSGSNTGDQTITLTGDVTGTGTGSFPATIANAAVTYAKIQNVSATDKLLGRATAGAGSIEEIALTAAGRALIDDVDAAAQRTTLGLGTLATQSGTFSGTSSGSNTGDQTITLTGDVTGTGTGSFPATIANNAVSLAKMATVATDRLLGRDTAGTGNVEALTVGGGLEFSGAGGIQRSALTGDVTASAGSGTTTIANSAVTYAKIQNVSAVSKLIGRNSTTTGPPEEITLGSGLSMSGTTLSASGGGGSGTKTIRVFSPNDNEPPSANYATLVYRNNHPTLAFDTATQEAAVFRGMIPEGTVLTSGLTVYVQWAAETATTGTIGWDIAFERVDAGGLDIDADNFGTPQTVTAATVSGTSGITSKTSVNFSQAQLPTSLAVGDQYRLRIRRDVANDTATGDAQLVQVEVRLQ